MKDTVIEGVRQLESRGVRLIVFSACLNYFELTAEVQVRNILESQMKAEKAITL